MPGGASIYYLDLAPNYETPVACKKNLGYCLLFLLYFQKPNSSSVLGLILKKHMEQMLVDTASRNDSPRDSLSLCTGSRKKLNKQGTPLLSPDPLT